MIPQEWRFKSGSKTLSDYQTKICCRVEKEWKKKERHRRLVNAIGKDNGTALGLQEARDQNLVHIIYNACDLCFMQGIFFRRKKNSCFSFWLRLSCHGQNLISFISVLQCNSLQTMKFNNRNYVICNSINGRLIELISCRSIQIHNIKDLLVNMITMWQS